jgi:hypothetical protein
MDVRREHFDRLMNAVSADNELASYLEEVAAVRKADHETALLFMIAVGRGQNASPTDPALARLLDMLRDAERPRVEVRDPFAAAQADMMARRQALTGVESSFSEHAENLEREAVAQAASSRPSVTVRTVNGNAVGLVQPLGNGTVVG